MQLAVHKDDANVLLQEKNELNESVVDKYRVAGQITQTALKYIISLINDSYHLSKTEKPYTCQELCILGDSMIMKLISRVYNNEVKEKGIATPVTIEVNEITNGFAPELNDESNYIFKEGDIVSITLGAHIDGYTANVSHTVVIYPPGVLVEDELKPSGPLLGSKADAICASHIAVETIVALLGGALSPEKIPQNLKNGGSINGGNIRSIVDSIAQSFNCVVVPGSEIRRIRRFLAGQAEGIVAERDFKGIVWDESSQEESILKKANASTDLTIRDKVRPISTDQTSAIPTDEFTIAPGEVYQVDIRMASLSDFESAGIITLEEIDEFTGKNNKVGEFKTKSTIHIRDFAINHQLKLKSARKLLTSIDRNFSVYPFKLTHTAESFPIDFSSDVKPQIDNIRGELKSNALGLSELSNRYLIRSRPVQVAKFVALEKILTASNPAGKRGIDANKPTLPGREIPLPSLGISSLKLKSFLKNGTNVPVAKELNTVIINDFHHDAVRLTGGEKVARPSWVHSNYKLTGAFVESINTLIQLTHDKRFGIKIKECQPINLDKVVSRSGETMQLD